MRPDEVGGPRVARAREARNLVENGAQGAVGAIAHLLQVFQDPKALSFVREASLFGVRSGALGRRNDWRG